MGARVPDALTYWRNGAAPLGGKATFAQIPANSADDRHDWHARGPGRRHRLPHRRCYRRVAIPRYDRGVKKRRFAIQKWIAAFVVCVFASAATAQDHDLWRFWKFSDGLQETFSYSLGVGSDGSVTIRHGAVSFMSVLDGYRVTHIADPHLDVRVDGVTRGRATLAENGPPGRPSMET